MQDHLTTLKVLSSDLSFLSCLLAYIDTFLIIGHEMLALQNTHFHYCSLEVLELTALPLFDDAFLFFLDSPARLLSMFSISVLSVVYYHTLMYKENGGQTNSPGSV